MPDFTNPFVVLFTGLGGTLLFASLVGLVLRHAVAKGQPNAVIDNLIARVNAWWWMVGLLGLVFWMGRSAVIGFFALLLGWASAEHAIMMAGGAALASTFAMLLLMRLEKRVRSTSV